MAKEDIGTITFTRKAGQKIMIGDDFVFEVLSIGRTTRLLFFQVHTCGTGVVVMYSRAVGGRVKIGDRLSLEVREIRGSQVRISITSPRSVSVDREEVRIRKTSEGAHR